MSWSDHLLTRWGAEHPIVLAPMAGGPSTPELAAAASEAGCLGMLGAAYTSPAAIGEACRRLRELTDRPFGVNLFLPAQAAADEAAIARMQALLDPLRESVGAPLSPPLGQAAEPFEAQLEAAIAAAPAVITFVFGCPPADLVASLHERGIAVMGAATCVREARALEAAGVDALVAQGAESGGHRATFPETRDPLVGTMALVPQVVDAVRIPVIAAGGIMDGRGIVAAMALGAQAVQMGTAFLAAAEAGTSAPHRQALARADDESSALTRAFSGRTARGLRNRFIAALAPHEEAILPFPLQNALTRGMRTAAAARGEAELLSLWAGQGAPLVRPGKVADLVAGWIAEADVVRARLAAGPDRSEVAEA